MNELRFEGGMKWAGNEGGAWKPSVVEHELRSGEDPTHLPARSSTSQGAGDIRNDQLPGFGAKQFAVAIDTGPVAVDNFIGSPQVPHSGGGLLSIMGRTGNLKSSSSGTVIWLRSHAPCGFIFSCSAFPAL